MMKQVIARLSNVERGLMLTQRQHAVHSKMLMELQSEATRARVIYSGDLSDGMGGTIDHDGMQVYSKTLMADVNFDSWHKWIGRNLVMQLEDPALRSSYLRGWKAKGACGWQGAPIYARPFYGGLKKMLAPLLESIRDILLWECEEIYEEEEVTELILNLDNLVLHTLQGETKARLAFEEARGDWAGGIQIVVQSEDCAAACDAKLGEYLEAHSASEFEGRLA